MAGPGNPGDEKRRDAAFEEAYRAYLKCVKEYWAKLDVEAIDLKQLPPGISGPHPWDFCVRCMACIILPFETCTYGGTVGTLGTLGTVGTVGGCIGTAGTAGTLATRGLRPW